MLRNLATVMIHPRATMRRILDASRDRLWLPIVLLVSVSATLGDSDSNGFRNLALAAKARDLPVPLVMLGLALGVLLAGLLFFYVFSWISWAIGKALEGTGAPHDVRRAMAWGLVPAIWALLYRVPAAFLIERSSTAVAAGEGFRVDATRIGSGCAAALIFSALELVTFVWCMAALSNTVGEAHGFSSWRGFATILLTSIAPIVIIVAAVLAM